MKLKGKWPPGKMDAYASEPLAEPIRKQKRNWSLLGDEELVAFAKRFIVERGIC